MGFKLLIFPAQKTLHFAKRCQSKNLEKSFQVKYVNVFVITFILLYFSLLLNELIHNALFEFKELKFRHFFYSFKVFFSFLYSRKFLSDHLLFDCRAQCLTPVLPSMIFSIQKNLVSLYGLSYIQYLRTKMYNLTYKHYNNTHIIHTSKILLRAEFSIPNMRHRTCHTVKVFDV